MRNLKKFLSLIVIHTINLFCNTILPNDPISSLVRKSGLRLLGNAFGKGTTVKGGGYFYGGGLTTGENCFINAKCYFDFSADIVFGRDVVVGHGVTFITAHHEMGSEDRRASRAITGQPISIGNGVWICANATILPGVTIGNGAVIAAGAVVISDVNESTLVCGVPAQLKKRLY